MGRFRKIFAYIYHRKTRFILLAILIGFAITPIIIITRTWFIVHTDRKPTAMPIAPVLETQTESFTCGVHSLSTIY